MPSPAGRPRSAPLHRAAAGATDAEIQAITGHKTRAMVARYTAGARQRRLTDATLAHLPGSTPQPARESSTPETKRNHESG